jgi:thiosulfate/3-mercaptopyruvate sulfurtransferase
VFQLLLISALAITPTSRPAPVPDIMVSASWLRTHIHDRGLVVLDVTRSDMDTPDPYGAGHIPGSRALDLNSIVTTEAGPGILTMQVPAVDSLRSVLERIGVSDGTTIVLYSTSRSVSPAARAFVTMDYLGLGNHTHILDGGYDAWRAAGGAVETVSAPAVRGSLHLKPRSGVLASANDISKQLGNDATTIIDARAPEFYHGTARGHSATRVGHIPGAHNVYFLTLADSVSSSYSTPEQARARFGAAGVRLDKPVIVYCHIGQTASVDYVQLRRLGVPVRLYDGSFEDWSRHSEYPVTEGAKP